MISNHTTLLSIQKKKNKKIKYNYVNIYIMLEWRHVVSIQYFKHNAQSMTSSKLATTSFEYIAEFHFISKL